MSIERYLIRDIRKTSVLAMTQNTGRVKQEQFILIAEGGNFIAHVFRDHKINKQWKYRYYPLGASL